LLLIAAGIFGLSYTWHIDHRSADSLSEYCDVTLKTSFYDSGKLEGAVLTLWDYRFDDAKLMGQAVLYTDGKAWEMRAAVKQTLPTYDFDRADSTRRVFQHGNKLFVQLPRFSLPAIREAKEVRFRFYYDNGQVIDLPLSRSDLSYWQQELLD
jgi:hypothetical protein